MHEAVGALKLENVRVLARFGANLNLRSNEGTLSADGERTVSVVLINPNFFYRFFYELICAIISLIVSTLQSAYSIENFKIVIF